MAVGTEGATPALFAPPLGVGEGVFVAVGAMTGAFPWPACEPASGGVVGEGVNVYVAVG